MVSNFNRPAAPMHAEDSFGVVRLELRNIVGMVTLLLLCGLLQVSDARADTSESDFLHKWNQVEALYHEIDGSDVSLTGAIGTMVGDDLFLASQDVDGLIHVELEAGRQARDAIQGCSVIGMTGGREEGFTKRKDGCMVEVKGEAKIGFDYPVFAPHYTLKLYVYELRRLP